MLSSTNMALYARYLSLGGHDVRSRSSCAVSDHAGRRASSSESAHAAFGAQNGKYRAVGSGSLLKYPNGFVVPSPQPGGVRGRLGTETCDE